jgi:N-acetylmuramoyl-L-alanine amidase
MKFLLSFVLFFNCNLTVKQEQPNFYVHTIPFSELVNDKEFDSVIQGRPRTKKITSIILHHTNDKTKTEYLFHSLLSSFAVHFIISKEGKIFGLNQPQLTVLRATPKMDDSSIHISLEGKEDEILNNSIQMRKVKDLIKRISQVFNIQLNNKYINSQEGVFTQTQAKKKYGNFVDLSESGTEKIIKEILTTIGGYYYPEEEWYGRYEKDWVLRKEKKNSKTNERPFDKGRGITAPTKIEFIELEKDSNEYTPEEFRLKYRFKQKINPSCIVLHYTAIPSFKTSQDVLEARGLSASIMVDKDAKAYQILDSIDDLAQAASGTNQNCIQIEIVGRNTSELLANTKQTVKVSNLVLELSKKFKIPLNNHRVEELKGIYSHTQAKKKWGGSIALEGKDFDPGEEYMKKIFLYINGQYYPEESWFDRYSNDWVMLYAKFQP